MLRAQNAVDDHLALYVEHEPRGDGKRVGANCFCSVKRGLDIGRSAQLEWTNPDIEPRSGVLVFLDLNLAVGIAALEEQGHVRDPRKRFLQELQPLRRNIARQGCKTGDIAAGT